MCNSNSGNSTGIKKHAVLKRNLGGLRIKGRDNCSYSDIGGDYPVIGPWGEGGFIIRVNNAPQSARGQELCDCYGEIMPYW